MLPNVSQPNVQSKPQKEGSESEQFWDLLGGKTEYPSQKIGREAERDPHLFSSTFSKVLLHGCNFSLLLQVAEIYNFTQDDLMTEDVFIFDCHSEIFVWVGQQVDTKSKMNALTIGEPDGCLKWDAAQLILLFDSYASMKFDLARPLD
ncbi:hypothetical protein GH714_016147 [Hevea brasiliensis]|uniref:Gelsolin-like domain-containing protein n=1 Tax=Hevea brasiliensis TaxID=3981 RepID=A0A6A6MYF4_HEVBR|nr:hypothetical protein GH714_016147 [Hevea brasiliensis]